MAAEDAVGQEEGEAVGVAGEGEGLAEAVEVGPEVAGEAVQEGGVEEDHLVVVGAEVEPREVASRVERPSSSSHIVTRASLSPVARRTRWSR